MKYALALGVALVFNAAANLLMKIGMKSVHADGGIARDGVIGAVKTVLTSGPLVVGLICFVLNAVCYLYALQSEALKISVAYPIMVGGGFALIAVIARFHPALSERLAWGQITGVAFVLLGITLIAAQTKAA
jgi:multidrug transporter EmrE-like cation transporter